jgi:hypothetical protein
VPEGPYRRQEVVIDAFSRNAYYVQDPMTKKHLIFHVGGGVNSSSKPWLTNCTNGTTPIASFSVAGHPPITGEASEAGGSSAVGLSGGPIPDIESFSPESHAADTLLGPPGTFRRVPIKGLPPSPAPPRGASNPAPYIFPKGTTLMLFRVYAAVDPPPPPAPTVATCS